MANSAATTNPIPQPTEFSPARRRGRRTPLTGASPDFTPMIDVTFQLLIFFLVTTTFIPDEGQLPASLSRGGGPVDVVKPMHLSVSESGDVTNRTAEYRLYGRTITDPQELFSQLASRRVNDQQALVIDVAPQCKWQYVIEAFNQAARADFIKIGFKQ